MEIGPISAIRPMAMVRPSSSARDLTGVFAVEFSEQPGDDSYAMNGRASRGLEDENAEDETPHEAADSEQTEGQTGTMSFFA